MAVTLVVTAVLCRAVRTRTFGIGSADPLTVPWATLFPLLQAGLIAVTVASVQAPAETVAVRVVPGVQLAAIAGLTVLAATLNAWSATGLAGPITAAAFDRNLLGLLGLALVSARLLGAALLWVLPVLTMTVALTLGSSPTGSRLWAWPIQPDTDRIALTVALLLMVIGAAVSWCVFDQRIAVWG